MGHFLAGISAYKEENQSNHCNSLVSRAGCTPRERGLICFKILHIALLDEKER